MSEDALKAEWISPILDIVSRECVSEDVRCDPNAFKLRSFGDSFDDSLHVAEFEPIAILRQKERCPFLMEPAHFDSLARASKKRTPHVYVSLVVALSAVNTHPLVDYFRTGS